MKHLIILSILFSSFQMVYSQNNEDAIKLYQEAVSKRIMELYERGEYTEDLIREISDEEARRYLYPSDSLILEPGRPAFIITLLNNNAIDHSYFLAAREYEELCSNFKELDPQVFFIQKNTLVYIKGESEVFVDLSSRSDRIVGLICWNGIQTDKPEHNKEQTGYTEFISKLFHLNKVSSYIKKYDDDIASYYRYRKFFTPSKNSSENAQMILTMRYLFDNHLGETGNDIRWMKRLFPNLKGVKEIQIRFGGDPESSSSSDEKKQTVLTFDKQGLLQKACKFDEDNSLVSNEQILYKDGLPATLVENEDIEDASRFYYLKDTLIMELTRTIRYSGTNEKAGEKKSFLFYTFQEPGMILTYHVFWGIFDESAYRIDKVKEILEGNCIRRFEETTKETVLKDCYTNLNGIFPYTIEQCFQCEGYPEDYPAVNSKITFEQVNASHYRIISDNEYKNQFVKDLFLTKNGNLDRIAYSIEDENQSIKFNYIYY